MEQEIKKNINNKFENKRFFDQLKQNQTNEMAQLKSKSKPYSSREDNLEQTDLDTLERDSKQDYDESEIDESDEQTESETNDELDEELNDDELDKDYRFLKRKFKNDYIQHKHLLPSTNFAENQPPIQQPKTMNSFSDQTHIPISSILPHYVSSNHLINSATNSDKLSNSDNHHLNKKTNELRKNEFKREYQRLDNQAYMMHSPSMNTSNANSNQLNAHEKSGCNL